MSQEMESPEIAAQPGNAQAVHAVMQFLRIVRYRKNVVITALLVSCLLGGLYYGTATRYYQSTASLMVLETGSDVTSTSIAADGAAQGLMPTYERLLTSAIVLQGAIPYIAEEHRIDLEGTPEDVWPATLRRNLSLSTARGTNIIEVGYKSREPKTSVAVINAVLKSYLEFMDRTHKGTSGEILSILTNEKTKVEQQLAAKEAELLAARQASGDLTVPTGSTTLPPTLQHAISLHQAFLTAQQKRLELQASLATIHQAIAAGQDLSQHVMALESSIGREILMAGMGVDFRTSNAEMNIERTLIADQAELKSLRDFYGPNHPKVVEKVEHIRGLEEFQQGESGRVAEQLAQMRDTRMGPMLIAVVEQQVQQALQLERGLYQNFEQAKVEASRLHGDLARINTLDYDVTFLRQQRDVYLTQIANVDLKQDRGTVRTAVVSEPQVPTAPVSPKLLVTLLLSIAGGLGCGLGLVYVMDLLDDRFRSPEDLRSQLGVPILAMIRPLEELHTLGMDAIQVHVAPDSVESEAFRTLRTTLAFAQEDTSRMVVSSAEPGDGKTTVLANLAVSYAQAGKKTLLIDADLRRPGLTNLLSLKGTAGLSDFLIGEGDAADIASQFVRRTAATGLDVISAGARRPNPAELLANTRMADLLAWAESQYDQILIDCPPALAASDASIVGRLVDGLVLVVQPRKNQRRMVVRAAESFTSLNINLLGVVLNRISTETGEDGYAYGYGYGYGYGAGYGQDADEELTGSNEGERQIESEATDELVSTLSGELLGESDGIVPRRRVA